MIRFLLSGLPRNSFLLLRWMLPDLAIVLHSDLAVFQRTWSRRILLVKPSIVFIFRGAWVLCFASETDMVGWLASHLIAGISCFDRLKSWHFIPFPGAAYLLPTNRGLACPSLSKRFHREISTFRALVSKASVVSECALILSLGILPKL